MPINYFSAMKNKKILLGLFSLSILMFLGSCSKDDTSNGTLPPVTTEDLLYAYDNRGTFPAGTENFYNALQPGVRVEIPVGTFASKTDSVLTAEGYTKEHVVSIKGESMDILMISPTTQNFDFMDSVWIYVSQLNETAKRLYAYKFNYAVGLNSLSMDMTNIDIKDVFNSDSVKIFMQATKRDNTQTLAPNTTIDFKTMVRFTVEKKQ